MVLMWGGINRIKWQVDMEADPDEEETKDVAVYDERGHHLWMVF